MVRPLGCHEHFTRGQGVLMVLINFRPVSLREVIQDDIESGVVVLNDDIAVIHGFRIHIYMEVKDLGEDLLGRDTRLVFGKVSRQKDAGTMFENREVSLSVGVITDAIDDLFEGLGNLWAPLWHGREPCWGLRRCGLFFEQSKHQMTLLPGSDLAVVTLPTIRLPTAAFGVNYIRPGHYRPRKDARMTDRYVSASELNSFTFCQRSWYLERQGHETELIEARELGAADHVHRAHSVLRARALARTARILFIVALVGLACAILLRWLTR
jgi:hypothetical protein